MGKYGWRRASCHRVSRSRGREKGGGGAGENDWFSFFFAREAYLMIFPQIDRQTRDGQTEHTCMF